MNWIADTSHGSGCLIILIGFSAEACGLGTQDGRRVLSAVVPPVFE
jgi:hypothetical protein